MCICPHRPRQYRAKAVATWLLLHGTANTAEARTFMTGVAWKIYSSRNAQISFT